MEVTFSYHPYKYFPYEKRLAVREIELLLGGSIKSANGEIRANIPDENVSFIHRLTYFRKADTKAGNVIIPDQTKWEHSSNGISVENGESSLNRQSTRYSLHSLHEYKGRFNPQIVRSVGNILKLSDSACVIDPFCGSGTALLEAAHIGWNAIGFDINPLAVLIANTKASLFKKELDEFLVEANPIIQQVEDLIDIVGDCQEAFNNQKRNNLLGISREVELNSFDYLIKWFPKDVLLQVQTILFMIQKVHDDTINQSLKMCLSNILREISWQEPADLRIRRRKKPKENYPAFHLFLREVTGLVKSMKNTYALRHLTPLSTTQLAICGDSRTHSFVNVLKNQIPLNNELFDAAITSPPYANALPYIDTQRLSLVLLGYSDAKDIIPLERRLIGNREITNNSRSILEDALINNEAQLPFEVINFLHDLLQKIKRADVGFRRRNLPALLYQYFSDMKRVLNNVGHSLKKDGAFAIVIGTNRTHIGTKEIIIPTPQFLVEIGLTVGYLIEHVEELDTYHRFNIHRKNSINSEDLIILRWQNNSDN